MTKHYINLTNGIEWLEELKGEQNIGFIRICSTTLEGKNYVKLFRDLDHDFLMNLALGTECIVYDCGANKEIARAMYSGIPIIRYVLNKRWMGIAPIFTPIIRRNGITKMNGVSLFDEIYNQLFVYNQDQNKEAVKTKLDYYKKFLNCPEVNLTFKSRTTEKDGDYIYYKTLLLNHYEKAEKPI